jgi:uncharacterized protein YyaL (SSP411 family)
MRDQSGTPNDLIEESSPYLLQHAYNPVKWVSWSEDAFKKAKEENKLVLVSVGYSSCHWCHVMEHESFEDESVAEVMNKHFVCIKVDREERPDIDQVYMSAVQLMTGQGGWPLNCVILPNGKPIYGGTYFRKEQWVQILLKLADLYKTEPDRMSQYSEEIEQGIKSSDLVQISNEEELSTEKLEEIVINWRRRFDNVNGGPNKAPKFPLPNNYDFLLRWSFHNKDGLLQEHVELTLDKMANGGIFDQVGGGFSRYSVDGVWKVPHFEKMLYDNGQLLGLYADGYKFFKKDHYKEVIEKTYFWLINEMKDDSGAFYSALDADSEGHEGKFYIWNEEELKSILKADFDIAKEVYNVNAKGFWEFGNYILLRNENLDKIAADFNLTNSELKEVIKRIDSELMKVRATRVRPGLDDKCLTAWNALLISGLVKSSQALENESYLDAAKGIADWIMNQQFQDGKLMHTFKEGKSTINGFLDDYATVLDAMLQMYQATFDARYFDFAIQLMDIAKEEFEDTNSGMFYFTSKESELIVRKIDTEDNVIPSTNSMMARNLYMIGSFLDKEDYKSQAIQMLKTVYDGMEQYGSAYSNWGLLLMDIMYPLNEIVISGEDYSKHLKEFQSKYIPNVIYLGGKSNSISSPLAEGKFETEKIYVCQNKTCKLPSDSVKEALKSVLI